MYGGLSVMLFFLLRLWRPCQATQHHGLTEVPGDVKLKPGCLCQEVTTGLWTDHPHKNSSRTTESSFGHCHPCQFPDLWDELHKRLSCLVNPYLLHQVLNAGVPIILVKVKFLSYFHYEFKPQGCFNNLFLKTHPLHGCQ